MFEGLEHCVEWVNMYNLTHLVLSDSLANVSYQYMPYLSIPHHTILDPNHVVHYTEHSFQYGAIRATLDDLMSPDIAINH